MHTILIKAVRSKLSTTITSDVKLYVWYGLLPPTNTLPSGKSAAVEWYILGIWLGLSTTNPPVGSSSGR